jgi:hypothetical protein
MKWEYTLRNKMFSEKDTMGMLNQMGGDGWEMCGVQTLLNQTCFFFKRRIP